VAELQTGIDAHDADIYNCHFAADVAWGSPYGATVDGYDQLHPIHQRLLHNGVGRPSSRYVIKHILPASDDVTVAHVARYANNPDDETSEVDANTGAFSEMALYVLVHHNGAWWLAAGQNTSIRPGGAI
jgi:hypothetical protein